MPYRRVLPFLTVLLSTALAAPAPGDSPISRLRAEADKYISSLKPEQRSRFGPEQIYAVIAQAGSALEVENYESALQTLTQLQVLLPSPGAAAEIDRLISTASAARERRNAQWLDSAAALSERTAQACLNATAIKDFDPLLLDLAKARANLGRDYNNPALQQAAQKLDAAITFARRWQDYLDKRGSGDERGAIQVMVELANSPQLFPVIPRSELLQRTHSAPTEPKAESKPDKPAAEKVDVLNLKLDSLADIPAAIEQLRPRLENRNSLVLTDEGRSIFQQLTNLQAISQAFESGQVGRAFDLALYSAGLAPTAFDELLQKLRQQLQFKILQRQLELPESLAASSDKTPADYLLRIMNHAKAKEDWPLLLRAYESYIAIAYNNGRAPDWVVQDKSSIALYVSGLNNEKAGNKQAALAAYNGILKLNTKYLPIDDVARRIKAITAAP